MNQYGKDFIVRYLGYVKSSRKHPYAENTLRAIRNTLEQFFEWWPEPLENFDPEDLEQYQEYLWSVRYRGEKYSIATVNQRLILLRKFVSGFFW